MNTQVNETGQRSGSPLRIAGWGTALCLVLAPAVAMLFSDEVNWGVEDFAFAIILIGGVGLALEFAVRASRSLAYRTGFAIALGAIFLTLWVNAAVGIVGEPENPANAIYFGILVLVAAGSFVARWRARGLGYIMLVAAAAEVVAGVINFSLDFIVPAWTVFMTLGWLAAAALFFKAANGEADGS